jgi:hypothetical protein
VLQCRKKRDLVYISSFTALQYIYIYIYVPSRVQPEDGSEKSKHVAENCKFIKCLIKKLLDYTLLFN